MADFSKRIAKLEAKSAPRLHERVITVFGGRHHELEALFGRKASTSAHDKDLVHVAALEDPRADPRPPCLGSIIECR
jgi:hypothetical protein